jgi:hypothetical protein
VQPHRSESTRTLLGVAFSRLRIRVLHPYAEDLRTRLDARRRATQAAADAAVSSSSRHLKPVERIERRGKKFAAVDLDVALVLGPHRGATTIYGFLASSWYEYAAPEQGDGKKRPVPGDWVLVSYQQLMSVTGTRAKDSIIRWIRILAEDTHPCLAARCAEEHPLIVVRRQGQNKPNLYRKWKCGEDELVLRSRVRSQKLSEAAQRRVAAGEHLNGIFQARGVVGDLCEDDAQLGLAIDIGRPSEGASETARKLDDQTSGTGLRKSGQQTSGSPPIKLSEVGPSNSRELDDQTSLRIRKDLKIQKTAEKADAATIDTADDVDAVACEVVDAVLELAQRTQADYPEAKAWEVARSLAAAILPLCTGRSAHARALLLHAIGDRRLARARNPVGLLRRGILGDATGEDRFLIDNRAFAVTARRDLVDNGEAGTPLCDELARSNQAEYQRRLLLILPSIELPPMLRERTLDHPMLLGMCRVRLERELLAQA